MTVGVEISVAGGKLKVLGNSILSDAHDNIFVTPATGEYLTNGAFIGVQIDRIGSRNVFPIGKLKDPAVQEFEGSHLVLVAPGSEPFDVITNAIKSKCHYSGLDVQNILETLGAGHGGRVKLARKYHQALEASISRNFLDNGIISCMSHNTDGLYR
ncbi:putative galactinol--sucrose galactosyltransferase 1 [Abeliophyllum distichum]|uniref:Galactinol--sucrose galactosyltransferase 1 n=1 Tax=Abeliophyllum distichum TaxID=126358 RepID=A0ABD1UNE7_9LAMI